MFVPTLVWRRRRKNRSYARPAGESARKTRPFHGRTAKYGLTALSISCRLDIAEVKEKVQTAFVVCFCYNGKSRSAGGERLVVWVGWGEGGGGG